MHSLSRRQAFVGALAATVLPTTANASVVDPHAAWVEKWFELDRLYWKIDPPSCAIQEDISRLGDLIMNTPAVTRDGMLAKIRLVKANCLQDGTDDQPAQLISQLEAFIGAQA